MKTRDPIRENSLGQQTTRGGFALNKVTGLKGSLVAGKNDGRVEQLFLPPRELTVRRPNWIRCSFLAAFADSSQVSTAFHSLVAFHARGLRRLYFTMHSRRVRRGTRGVVGFYLTRVRFEWNGEMWREIFEPADEWRSSFASRVCLSIYSFNRQSPLNFEPGIRV